MSSIARMILIFSIALAVLAIPLTGRAAVAAAQVKLETAATGLDHPWSLAFLPDGIMLVTEREGSLKTISATGVVSAPIAGTPSVAAEGQGGLLDVALHPKFTENRMVYLSFAEARDGGQATAVARGRLSDDLARLENVDVIFRQTPAVDSGRHFGSRLVFDGSGALFVTTGDRGNQRDLVQQGDNFIGKIIRIADDGSVPPGNPIVDSWRPEIWSIGHRNLQGATLHPETGALWTVEHGARGGDELNHPEAGMNYGWPVISFGREYSMLPIGEGAEKPGLEQPVHYWDPSIAPSGMAFYSGDKISEWTGSLFVGALVGEHLARLTLKDGTVVAEEKLFEGEARIRDVRQGPDGALYLLTDEAAPDGRVLRIIPAP